jgi:glycosyltransferase involved in cell wall biosynthesis
MVLHGTFPVGEPRFAAQVRAATDAGFDVDVISLRRNGDRVRETVEGVRVVRVPFSHRRGASFAWTAAEYFGFTAAVTAILAARSVRRPYDVVGIASPPDFLVASALVPRLLGSYVLLDVHDLSSDMFAMRFGDSRLGPSADRALRALERWAARHSDAVLTVHEPYRDELVNRGVPAGKIDVVMNALDERYLPRLPAPARNGGFRVVYHGTITPSYGVGLLVEAAGILRRDLPELSLEIYGEGDSVPAIRQRAAELGIAERLTMTGEAMPQPQVLERVVGASVGVVPNLPTRLNHYALSSKLLEYVALGIPAVSGDLPTIRAHFAPDEVLFFRAGDAASLAGALLERARDPAAAALRADAARKRYESYRWPVQAARFIELLSRLSGRATGRRLGFEPRPPERLPASRS